MVEVIFREIVPACPILIWKKKRIVLWHWCKFIKYSELLYSLFDICFGDLNIWGYVNPDESILIIAEMIQDTLNFININCVTPIFVEKDGNNKAKLGDAIREVESLDLWY